MDSGGAGMNKVSELVFEQFTDTTVLVNSGFKTYGEIYKWDGHTVLDIKTICLSIVDLEAIIAEMKNLENEGAWTPEVQE